MAIPQQNIPESQIQREIKDRFNNRWTTQEKNKLRKLYNDATIEKLTTTFNKRSIVAIREKARLMGLKRNKEVIRESFSHPKPYKINDMKSTNISYIAGLFDGEGCIQVVKNKKGAYHFRASISNSHYGVLEWLKRTTGIGGIYKLKGAGKNKQQYEWIVSGRNIVADFLEILCPILLVKREQSELVVTGARGFFGQTKAEIDKSLVEKLKGLRMGVHNIA